MASGKLVEAHIMVKTYWFLDLAFGKGPTQYIITLLNGSSNAGMDLIGASVKTFWFGYQLTNVTSLAKFCHTAPNLRPIKMSGYLAVGFYWCLNGHPLKTCEPISLSHFSIILAQQSGVLSTVLQMQRHLEDSTFA